MARTEKVIMTNMCMVFSENRVLVQDKTDDDYSGITFPGGHVERGESFTDAVIREVWEETGLKISEPKLCGIKDWMKDEETRYIVLLYKTDKFEGIVTSSEEGDVFWLTLDEMKQRKLAYGMDKEDQDQKIMIYDSFFLQSPSLKSLINSSVLSLRLSIFSNPIFSITYISFECSFSMISFVYSIPDSVRHISLFLLSESSDTILMYPFF